MTTLYGLSAGQVQRLKSLLDRLESNELSIQQTAYGRRDMYADRCLVGLLDAEIAACASLTGTPIVGTLNVYSFSSTGTVDTTRDETVYNFAPAIATTDRWTVCQRDNMTGRWVIHTQFCT